MCDSEYQKLLQEQAQSMESFVKAGKEDKKKLEKEKKAERDEMQKTYRDVALSRAIEMKKLNKSVRKSRESASTDVTDANIDTPATEASPPSSILALSSPTSSTTLALPSPQTPPLAPQKRQLKSNTPDGLTEFGIKLDEMVRLITFFSLFLIIFVFY